MSLKTLSPKDLFQASPAAAAHAELVNRPEFQQALAAALAEMTSTSTRAEGLEVACRAHYEVIGANKFISVLLNLTTSPEPRPTLRQNLVCPPSQQPPQQNLKRPQPPTKA